MFSKNISLCPDTIIGRNVAIQSPVWGKALTLVPELSVQRMSNKDTAPATVYMTIKDDHGSLLYRKELTLGSSNQLTGSTIKVADGSVLAQKMSAGKIQVTYSILNELENATAKLTIFRDSVVKPCYSRKSCSVKTCQGFHSQCVCLFKL